MPQVIQQVVGEVGFESRSFCSCLSKAAGLQGGVRLSTKMGDFKTDARQGEKEGGLPDKTGGKMREGVSQGKFEMLQ